MANSKEEFRRLLEKVPDFKIKPDKVPPETIKIKEKTSSSNLEKGFEDNEGEVRFHGPVTSRDATSEDRRSSCSLYRLENVDYAPT